MMGQELLLFIIIFVAAGVVLAATACVKLLLFLLRSAAAVGGFVFRVPFSLADRRSKPSRPPEPVASGPRKCPDAGCGFTNRTEAKYCAMCGRRLP
jgi:hypothetical protein